MFTDFINFYCLFQTTVENEYYKFPPGFIHGLTKPKHKQDMLSASRRLFVKPLIFVHYHLRKKSTIVNHGRPWLTMLSVNEKHPYCTISPKGIVQFWSCNKAVANVFPHKAEPSSATRTGQYLLD